MRVRMRCSHSGSEKDGGSQQRNGSVTGGRTETTRMDALGSPVFNFPSRIRRMKTDPGGGGLGQASWEG
jgi:hypothetical protein